MIEQVEPKAALEEYKSFYRQHKPGEDYVPADEVLNTHAADGWELVSVAIHHGNSGYVLEIFYMKRKALTPMRNPKS